MSEYQKLTHEFMPVFDGNSRILILGSFPSAKSREIKFYYGHPQNRFWKVLAALFDAPAPLETVPEKEAFLLKNGIALWDMIAECEIKGSSDSSIRNVVPNDLSVILDAAPVRKIYTNGGTAYRLYMKYQHMRTGMDAVRLPSTSPANAAWSLEALVGAWGCVAAFDE